VNRRVLVVIAVAVLTAVAVGGVLLQRPNRATPVAVGSTTASARGAAGVASSITAAPSPTGASPSAAAGRIRGSSRSSSVVGPLLLWPFTTEQQALEWEQANREGHQPWHCDPCGTALSFVQSVLGFTDVTQVAECEVSGDDAWVTVGYSGDDDRVIPAGATIHLVRLGHDPGGWTVVGSRDRDTLTLTAPRYGAGVGRHVYLAGQVFGLGEDMLTVRVIDRTGHTVGEAPKRLIGLGGPWEADITLANPNDQLLIAVASTDSGLGSLGDLAITALVLGTAVPQLTDQPEPVSSDQFARFLS
jgi:hypothetical protein